MKLQNYNSLKIPYNKISQINVSLKKGNIIFKI